MTSSKLTLETVTGKLVDVLDPQPDQIDINDIAWGLSRYPRFAGHTITEVPYNVAQHSLLVCDIVGEIYLSLYGKTTDKVAAAVKALQIKSESDDMVFTTLLLKSLLHDSAEVYTGDIPSPVKKHPAIYDAIKEIEGKLTDCIFKKFLMEPMDANEYEIIHFADMVARAIEAHAFMHSRGDNWGMPQVSLVRLQKFEAPMTSIVSYNKFLEKFRELY